MPTMMRVLSARVFTSAARVVWRTPLTTLASVLTLALATGATTAIFSVVYGVLARRLPFADPGALVQFTAMDSADRRPTNFSLPEFADWQARTQVFTGLAMFAMNPFTMSGDGDATAIRGAVVSDRFFDVLGVPFAIGRPLQPGDDRTPVAVVSHGLWRRQLGARGDVVGSRVTLNGQPYTIVGVAPPALRFPADDVDAWIPVGFAASVGPSQWKMRGFRAFSMVGRLKPGTTIAQARDDASGTAAWLAQAFPRFSDRMGVEIVPLRAHLTARVRPALLMLFAAAGVVLMIACANLASLALVRTIGRAREIALRTAVGASRLRLFGQFLAESAVLGAMGAAAGLLCAYGVITLLIRMAPAELPRVTEIRLDLPVLMFALALTTCVTGLCAAVPALMASRVSMGALRESKPVSRRGTRRLHRALVAVEIGLSVVLLTGALLLTRSLSALTRNDLGVRDARVLTLKLNLVSTDGSDPAQRSVQIGRLLEAIGTIGGVRSVGATSSLPPHVSQMHTSLSAAKGQGTAPPPVSVEIVSASPSLFATLGVPLTKGRGIEASDGADTRRVLVLSETAARRLFPNGDPLAQRVPVGPADPRFGDPEVVGVVGDVRYSGLDAPPDGAVYVPYTQLSFRVMYLAVGTYAAPMSVASPVRQAIASADPLLAVSDLRTLDGLVSDATAQPRFRTLLLASLSGLAVLLAGVGLYGVIAYTVTSRSAEIGIRMALGAARGDVLRMVLQEGVLLVVTGVALGVTAAMALTPLASRFLYGVGATDPISFLGATMLVAVMGCLASVVPAVRATRVDPMVALRA
jgi:putative ABC transport system permease protein